VPNEKCRRIGAAPKVRQAHFVTAGSLVPRDIAQVPASARVL